MTKRRWFGIGIVGLLVALVLGAAWIDASGFRGRFQQASGAHELTLTPAALTSEPDSMTSSFTWSGGFEWNNPGWGQMQWSK